MSERMPPAEPAEADRPRWWKLRPPAGHGDVARGVWWTGQLQLFVALALVLVCLPLFVIGLAVPWEPAPGWYPDSFRKLLAAVWPVLLGLAMAGPFALSGRMLRASSGLAVYRRKPAGGGFFRRLLALAMTVTGIALVSVALTACAVWALVGVVATVDRLNGA